MHKLYDLKDMLCEELEEYGDKESIDVGSLEIIDKLAHSLKNIEKIIMMHDEESEYSERGSYAPYNRDYRYDRERGISYARGRERNARRDSIGRYSRHGSEMVDELRELMNDTPDEHTRQEIQQLIHKMEGM